MLLTKKTEGKKSRDTVALNAKFDHMSEEV